MSTICCVPSERSASGIVPEKLLTFQEVAETLGIYYWQLQRAVKRGDIPHYAPFNSRKLVKLSEVVAYIDSSRKGGVE
ncbi:helix-turn-helix domain-containing protein [Rhizobium miluonense]|uniref:DNA binding domain-containing protein, excisionase family n=1 Tax=Rhizobium miluonense TaxID=411945 RepID=A0A1C3XEH5_9HYPH|nr:helix-turn-helix domain-containing protein [Rhizobium miluonense]SCB50506.1 DNA binding domain-containing protein, excisionase family [Rhizobium miluonense]